jgi:hypothetical protein
MKRIIDRAEARDPERNSSKVVTSVAYWRLDAPGCGRITDSRFERVSISPAAYNPPQIQNTTSTWERERP